ncbi:MAG: hypothetical protein EU529_00775 [Promethearchaeota archaeon]|nr:MAG: hypothetical protein EU529_00775 [Candidatus Lokiarchaeota archaeon]
MDRHTHTNIEEARQCVRNTILNRIMERWKSGCDKSGILITFLEFGINHKKSGKEFLESRTWANPSKKREYIDDIKFFLQEHIN